ncbi:acyltransferase domain-containing protein, partial [Streptomyces spectabilis]|uniref:acyltransferase domain-containing protein n=1 Tax=Streptomyces spectabilis TaxID=68270 RepID=UPI0033F739CC
RTEQGLSQAARAWAERLEQIGPEAFYDAAFTACRRRTRHERRYAVLARDPLEAAAGLRALAEGEPHPGAAGASAVEHGRVGFVFSGNGSQWPGMGARMLALDAVFRGEVAACDAVLTPLLGWSVLEDLARAEESADAERWNATEVAQPLLFVVQAALVASLAARGIRPQAVTGHSVGEVAAAYCAGALDRAAACRVIAERSRAQAATAGAGRMAAVGLGHAEMTELLAQQPYDGRCVVAAVNSSRDVTVSGPATALAELGASLSGRGAYFRDLGLDYAFHSPAMDTLKAPLHAALAELAPRACRVPLVSAVTGARIEGRRLGGDYWWRNVREPVLFADAAAALLDDEACDVVVEIGPHPVLGGYLRRAAAERARPVAIVPTLSRTSAGPSALDRVQAHLVAADADLAWDEIFPRGGAVVSLPAYPWQRERHWNGDPSWWESHRPTAGARRWPLLGVRRPEPDACWQQEFEPGAPPWLADHRVGRAVVLPAAGYVDIALAASQEIHDGPAELTGLAVLRALTLISDASVALHTTVTSEGALKVTSRSGEGADWTEHARARVRALLAEPPAGLDITTLRAALPDGLTAEEHYARCALAGLPYGPAFRPLTSLRHGAREVLARYTTPPGTAEG